MGAVYRYLESDYLLYKYLVDVTIISEAPSVSLTFENKSLWTVVTTPSDVRRYDVHVSTTPNFTPSQANRKYGITTLDGTVDSGALVPAVDYSTTYYVKLVPYPESGPAGPASNEVSGVFYAGTVSTPSFTVASGSYSTYKTVEISSPDANLTYRYTLDGTDPTEASSVFSSLTVYGGTKTLKVKGFRQDYRPSETVSATYTVNQTASLLASGATNAGTITLSWGSVSGATGYKLYSDAGAGGSISTLVYDGVATTYPDSVTAGTAYRYQVKAYGADWETALSSEVSATAYLGTCASVSFSVAAGTYYQNQSVSLSSATSGASIYYTTDGSTPSTSSSLYSQAITVETNTTIKAFAVKAGWIDGSVTSASYTIIHSAPQISSFTNRLPSIDENYATFDVSWSSVSGATGYKIYADASQSPSTVPTTLLKTVVGETSTSILLTPGVYTNVIVKAYGSGWETGYQTIYPVIGYVGTCAVPSFAPESGTFSSFPSLSLSTSTSGGSVYYKVNGGGFALFSNPITVNQSKSVVITAYASKSGWINSATVSETYDLSIPGPVITGTGSVGVLDQNGDSRFSVSWTQPSQGSSGYYLYYSDTPGVTKSSSKVLVPTTTTQSLYFPAGTKYFAMSNLLNGGSFETELGNEVSVTSYSGQAPSVTFGTAAGSYSQVKNVSLSCSLAGAAIRYTTDGSTPTESSSLYSSPIRVASSQTIKAKAFKAGFTASELSSAAYTISLPGPTVIATGSNQGASISLTWNSVDDATSYRVYYETGGDPTASSSYLSPGAQTSLVHLSVTPAVAYYYKVKAYGSDFETELGASTFTTAYLGTVANPVVTPEGGVYFGTTEISASCQTAGADIYLTIDGTDPSDDEDMIYTGAFTLTEDATVKVVAYKSGYKTSSIVTNSYDLTVPSAVITLPKTELAVAEKVTVSLSKDGIATYPAVQAADPAFQQTSNWRWITLVYTNQAGQKRYDGFDARTTSPQGVIKARDASGSSLTLQKVYIVLNDRRRLKLRREDLDDPQNFDFSVV